MSFPQTARRKSRFLYDITTTTLKITNCSVSSLIIFTPSTANRDFAETVENTSPVDKSVGLP